MCFLPPNIMADLKKAMKHSMEWQNEVPGDKALKIFMESGFYEIGHFKTYWVS
jgi:hypothetical protein